MQNLPTNCTRTDFDTSYTSGPVFMQASALWVLEHSISQANPQNPQTNLFWVTCNGKPMANKYLHKYTMYRATTLKFSKLFDLAKYLEHT